MGYTDRFVCLFLAWRDFYQCAARNLLWQKAAGNFHRGHGGELTTGSVVWLLDAPKQYSAIQMRISQREDIFGAVSALLHSAVRPHNQGFCTVVHARFLTCSSTSVHTVLKFRIC